MENNHLKDVILVEKFKGIVCGDTNRAVYDEVLARPKSLKVYDFDSPQFDEKLIDSVHNTVVAPLHNKTFVTRMLNILNKSTRKFDITVVGMDKWNKFGYIDYRYLNNLNVHTPRNYFVQYDSVSTQKVLKEYRSTYSTEPDEWGFLGLDIGLYFFNELQTKGTAFYNRWNGEQFQGISHRFQFERMDPNSGFENKASQLIKMEHYYEILVNP